MTTNVGMIDRFLRIGGGIALILFALGYFWPATGWNWVGWIGFVPIITGLAGNCPVYTLLGLSTCPAKRV